MDYDDEETDSDEDIRETYGYDMKVITWPCVWVHTWSLGLMKKLFNTDVWGLRVEEKANNLFIYSLWW